VSTSAWYAWAASAAQGPSRRQREEAELVAEIRTIHTDSHGTYGSPRVHAELRRRGWGVNRKRVERLMGAHGIVGYRPRRRRSLTRPDAAAAAAPDLVGRLFDPDRPDVAWCSDVTYIPTDEGWLYLASVIDLASRHLLGWSMGDHHDAALVVGGLEAAVATRGRQRMDATIFHTDRGSGIHLVPGQRRRRELVRHPQSRARRPPPLPHPRPGARLDLRLDPPLQPSAAALHHRLPATRGMGTPLHPCPPATIDHSRITTVSGCRGEVQLSVHGSARAGCFCR
jgi:transposase InsO family protein